MLLGCKRYVLCLPIDGLMSQKLKERSNGLEV